MPWNGYPRDIAPSLTLLEKRSVSYKNAYAISSYTSKSVGPLLAGNYPSAMTRDGVFFTRYFDDNLMFPVVLDKSGVSTLSAHTHMYLAKGRGFDRGFRDYRIVDGISFDYNKDPYVTSHKLTPLAISMLTEWAPKAPFFAWFHYMDPHDTYLKHTEVPSFGKKARDLYDGEVRFTDEWIGKLVAFIEASSWGKNTAIIVTGDHGEAFGEHGMYRHAHELWEELVHVPLFFLLPGVAPRRVEVARGAVDLGPTILDLLRVDKPPEMRGESLAPEIFDGKDAAPRPVVCDLPEDTYNERRRAVIDDGRKIISFGNDVRYEVYDLTADPGEKINLLKKDPEMAKAMIARYKEVSRTIRDVPPRGGIVRPPE
jgi:choline-sulfatase